MYRSILLFLVVFISIVSCRNQEPYQGNYLDISFEEKLKFGTKDTVSKASFYAIWDVKADENNRIYVVAAAKFHVKVFSSKGDFLYQFGGRGRGPGEFVDMQGGVTLRDSTISIWDQSLQRITTYSTSGKLTSTEELKGIGSPLKIYPLADKNLVLYATLKQQVKENSLAHIYSRDFSSVETNFMPVKNIDHGIEDVRLQLVTWPGNVHVINEGNFYYIPSIFGENIYEFTQITSAAWEQKIHKGMNSQRPYSLMDQGVGRKPDASISLTSKEEDLAFIKHNQSRGLVEYKDLLFHFSLCDIGDQRVFGAAIYDKQLSPIGYVPIKSIPITTKEDNYLSWFARDVDDNGNFYIMERYNGGSRVRVFHLDYQELKPYL